MKPFCHGVAHIALVIEQVGLQVVSVLAVAIEEVQEVVEHYYWLLGRNGARVHIVGRGIQLWDVLVLAAVHAISGVTAKPDTREFLRAGSAL